MDTKTHSGNVGEPIIVKINLDKSLIEVMLGSFEDRDQLPYLFSVQPNIIFVFGMRSFTMFRLPVEDKLRHLRTILYYKDSQVIKFLDYVISVINKPNEYLVYIHPDKYMLKHEFRKILPNEVLEVSDEH